MAAKRSIKVEETNDRAFLVTITEGKHADYYLCSDLDVSINEEAYGVSRRILWEKGDRATGQQTEAEYVTVLGLAKDRCDCPGHKYHGKCRHVDGLRALQAAGRLPAKPRITEQPAEADFGWPRHSNWTGD